MMIIYSENKTGFTSTHEKVDSCSETGMSNGYSVIFSAKRENQIKYTFYRIRDEKSISYAFYYFV